MMVMNPYSHHMKSSTRTLAAAGAFAVALAAPTAAFAAPAPDTKDSEVTAVIGEELSIVVDETVALAPGLTHTIDATGAIDAKVTSTVDNFDVAVREDAGDGRMANTTATPVGPASLEQALQIQSEDIAAFAPLSATDQVVFHGIDDSVKESTVQLKQELNEDEDVVADETYALTALFSATAK